jgi:hypothetical protein
MQFKLYTYIINKSFSRQRTPTIALSGKILAKVGGWMAMDE